MKIIQRALLTAFSVILLAPVAAHAHLIGGNGLSSGITHPLLGLDHLLAMVAVGIVSVRLGGRAIWSVPATFVGTMVLGGTLAIAGIHLPFVEPAIALSVLVLGLAIALSRRVPVSAAMACVALFALFHGHAHGEELPLIANPATYITGFVLATTTLHVTGVLIGHWAAKTRMSLTALRYAGAAMSMAGVVFLFS